MTDQRKNESGVSSEQFVGSNSVNRALTRLPEKSEPYSKRAAGFRKFFNKHKKAITDKHGAAQKHGRIFLFFGVILPLAAIAFEMTTHFCARHFFDPFPSANHVVLFSLIPLSNYLAWLAGRKDLSAHYGFMALISGMAMGIGCLYGLMFLPLTPISCFYSLALGFGLLGLAPLLAIPCTWLSGKTVCRLATNKKTFFDPHQVEHIGHLIVLCMVVAVELPSTLTRMNLSLAADPATAKDGIHWLRNFGSQEVMLRACYERSGRATDILGSLYESAHPITIDQARSIFYTVTGKPFNTVPIPSSARATMQHAGNIDDIAGVNATVQDEFDLDADIAGETVSGVARGLSVSDSILTGEVNPDSAVGELKWSFTFKNDSAIDREARAKILLPPGAVVSKATLTINGVERDATIMVRSVARAYYRQAVAEHKKDPLLVSMCGLDQLLVQCFPVQPGQATKVTLTIATPLVLDENDKGALVLPAFEERNFQFEIPTTVQVDAIQPPKLQKIPDVHLNTKFEPAKMARFDAILKFDRDKYSSLASTFVGDTTAWQHHIRLQSYPKPDRLTVIIDGSASMQNFKSDILHGLKGLPNRVPASIFLVGDETTNLMSNKIKPGESVYAAALAALDKFQPIGGHDDGQVLQNALNSAAISKNDAVLWIHAAQPVSSANKNSIKTALENQSPARSPLLYDLQVAAGPDELLNDIDTTNSIVRVSRAGSISEDMNRLYRAWQTPAPKEPEYSVTTGSIATFSTTTGVTTTGLAAPYNAEKADPLARLFAYHQILEDLQSKDQSRVQRAYGLAGEFHLITPISSAVVVDNNPIPATTENKKADADAAKAPFNFDLAGALEKAKDKAFNSYVGQLNNLSSAASVAGSGGGQVASVDTKQYNTPSQSELYSAKPQAISVATLATNASMRRGSHSFSSPAPMSPKSLQAGDDFSRSDSRARDEKRLAGAPGLQGATNGTIGPQEGYNADQLKNAEPQKEEAENRISLGIPQNSPGVFESQQAAQSSPPLFQLPDFNPFGKVSEQEKTFSSGSDGISPAVVQDDAGTWLNRIVTAAFALLIIELTFLTVRRNNARKSKE